MTTLTSSELAQLADMRAQARIEAAAGVKSYFRVYETLANWLTTRYGVSSTDPAVLWLRGATEANAGRGAMSELIRGYTEESSINCVLASANWPVGSYQTSRLP